MTATILPFPLQRSPRLDDLAAWEITAYQCHDDTNPRSAPDAAPQRVLLNGQSYTVVRNLADRAVVEGADGFQRVTSLNGATFLH